MSDTEAKGSVKRVPSWVEQAPDEKPTQEVREVAERVQTLIEAAEQAAEAIKSDAERQAVEYLQEAQRRADRLTSERIGLVASLTDNLIGHAGAVKSHSEQMVESLERTIQTITEGESIAELSAGEEPSEPGEESPIAESERSDAHEPDSDQPGHESEPEPTSAGLDAASVTAYPGTADPPKEVEQVDQPEQRAGTPTKQSESGEPDSTTAPDETSITPEEVALDEAEKEAAVLHATRLAIAGNERDEIAEVLKHERGIDDPDAILDRVLG